VAGVLLGSGGSGAPGACSCAAEKAYNIQDALPNHLVYPRLSRPQSESCLPAIYVERKWGHSHFCLETAYRCGLVGSSNGFEASVFGFLEALLQPLFKRIAYQEGANQAEQPVAMAGQTTAVCSSLVTRSEAPHVEAVSLLRTLVCVASFDLMCCRCGCQLSCLSRVTAKTRADGLGLIENN
jgi:hypothetical protein